jgi:hypothetical protein
MNISGSESIGLEIIWTSCFKGRHPHPTEYAVCAVGMGLSSAMTIMLSHYSAPNAAGLNMLYTPSIESVNGMVISLRGPP